MTPLRHKILDWLRMAIGQQYLELTTRGNTAINAALSIIPPGRKILIPAEGGWLHYRSEPKKRGLVVDEVSCHDAKISLPDLRNKLFTTSYAALLYQNPGGYFAEQPMKEIYDLCHQHNCIVILDVSGSIGTSLADGRYADIMVCSFGKWKLIEANVGGFVSCREQDIFEKLRIEKLDDESAYTIILEKLQSLSARIAFLEQKRKTILRDLQGYTIISPHDLGFVVVVKYTGLAEKEKIINYCDTHQLPWTECPRYIRVNSPAISIEVKQIH
ncbi:DegT/DnrJ/EryC1/StrS family aminotransferase [Candidatus Woesearchaeota archaeon]|nr:DegT/DnrJ/EryC1/StrS family aminotransferase [Candidatus Woesearchaeota archaeon]